MLCLGYGVSRRDKPRTPLLRDRSYPQVMRPLLVDQPRQQSLCSSFLVLHEHRTARKSRVCPGGRLKGQQDPLEKQTGLTYYGAGG